VSSAVGTHMTGVGRMWLGLFLNGVWSVATLSISFFLVRLVGAMGASIGVAVGYATLAAISVLMGWRVLGLQYSGMAVPSLWSGTVVGVALIVSSLTTGLRFPLGVSVVALSLLSAIPLLNASERSIVIDLLDRARRWIGITRNDEA